MKSREAIGERRRLIADLNVYKCGRRRAALIILSLVPLSRN